MSIGFVVDKAAMRQVFLLVPHFPNISDHFTIATNFIHWSDVQWGY